MVLALSDHLGRALLERRTEHHRGDAAPGTAVDDPRPDDHRADPFLRERKRQLLVLRAPGEDLRGVCRLRLVHHGARRIADHPDAARVDEGRADPAVQQLARVLD